MHERERHRQLALTLFDGCSGHVDAWKHLWYPIGQYC